MTVVLPKTTKFLKNPSEIRKAFTDFQGNQKLDLAVAFVGADWKELLVKQRGKLRLICWLSSTNTNPYAVRELKNRNNVKIRQRDSMHCKVYLSSQALKAIIGSANLSRTALSENESAGQDEAATLVTDKIVIHEIQEWFDKLWNDRDTHKIKDTDITHAIEAWERARKNRDNNEKHYRRNIEKIPHPPLNLNMRIRSFADQVRSIDIQEELDSVGVEFTQTLAPENLTKRKKRELVRHICMWTGHSASYENFLHQPLAQAQKGLELLFDESIDLRERLKRIQDKNYLNGLRMPSLSLLLYWRYPENYPPYNFQTKKFLDEFGLRERGMSASSADCYATWVRWAVRLAQQLKLPSAGHIDRMVSRHYQSLKQT